MAREILGQSYRVGTGQKVAGFLEDWHRPLVALQKAPDPKKFASFKNSCWSVFQGLYKAVYKEILDSHGAVHRETARSALASPGTDTHLTQVYSEETTIVHLAEADIAKLIAFAVELVKVEYTSKLFEFVEHLVPGKAFKDPETLLEVAIQDVRIELARVARLPLVGGERANALLTLIEGINKGPLPGFLTVLRGEVARATAVSTPLLQKLDRMRKSADYAHTAEYYEALLELAMMQELLRLARPDVEALQKVYDDARALQDETNRYARAAAEELARDGFPASMKDILAGMREQPRGRE